MFEAIGHRVLNAVPAGYPRMSWASAYRHSERAVILNAVKNLPRIAGILRKLRMTWRIAGILRKLRMTWRIAGILRKLRMT